ncbi:MAG: ADP-ribosylglycohydrolase family protein [bacterium]
MAQRRELFTDFDRLGARAAVHDIVRGCLIGGAVGDALGAAVEFHRWDEIEAMHGAAGVTDFDIAYDVRGAITDDTQMTLFTADGLIRARRARCDPTAAVHRAYLRWLHTQGQRDRCAVRDDGWLIAEQRLWSSRAPGTTCLNALAQADAVAQCARNGSKGCGTVMRVAPIGLMAVDAFDLSRRCSALTHGHPTAQIAGGAFACLIGSLLRGVELPRAVADALEQTRQHERAAHAPAETSAAIEGAVAAAELGLARAAQSIESFGGGWVAEEALAIGIYCALSASEFADGVLRAVNHSGDSDSTGAIAGNILGVVHGYAGIPAHWRETVELADVISTLARDMVSPDPADADNADARARYPQA